MSPQAAEDRTIHPASSDPNPTPQPFTRLHHLVSISRPGRPHPRTKPPPPPRHQHHRPPPGCGSSSHPGRGPGSLEPTIPGQDQGGTARERPRKTPSCETAPSPTQTRHGRTHPPRRMGGPLHHLLHHQPQKRRRHLTHTTQVYELTTPNVLVTHRQHDERYTIQAEGTAAATLYTWKTRGDLPHPTIVTTTRRGARSQQRKMENQEKKSTAGKNEAKNLFFRPQKPLRNILRRCLTRSQNLGHSQKTKNKTVTTRTNFNLACPGTPSKVPVLGTRDLCAPQPRRRKKCRKTRKKKSKRKQAKTKQQHQRRPPRRKYVKCCATRRYVAKKSKTVTAPTRKTKWCNRETTLTPARRTHRERKVCPSPQAQQGHHHRGKATWYEGA